MNEPKLEQRAAEPYLALGRRVEDGNVAAAVDGGFPEFFSRLGELGIEPAGAPLIRFVELDDAGDPLALELAAPVTAHPDGETGLLAQELPPGTYATLLHTGPYRHETVPDLAAARATLRRWADERGIVWAGEPRRPAVAIERYLVGPPMEADWTRWRTEFAYLVEAA